MSEDLGKTLRTRTPTQDKTKGKELVQLKSGYALYAMESMKSIIGEELLVNKIKDRVTHCKELTAE